MRYFLHIGYHGTRYSGWQSNPGVRNVQQVLEHSLLKIFKIPITVFGCGRTDAQVHASQYFCHIDIANPWDFDLLFRLNKVLPADIAVFEVIPMQPEQHARFDAMQRTYDYFIHCYKDPFLSAFSSMYLLKNLDTDAMKRAAALLPKYNDYRAFCKSPDKNEHTLCEVSFARVYTNASGDRIRFQISANRFLGKMIRIIVGKLLAIGRGNLTVDEFEQLLIDKQTPISISPAHPQGLYLSKVTYPYLDIPARTTFTCMLQNDVDEEWMAV